MVLGMSLETFTLVHVLISLVGIASGIVVMYGFLIYQRLERWTAIFLVTTGLTSVTGFLFRLQRRRRQSSWELSHRSCSLLPL